MRFVEHRVMDVRLSRGLIAGSVFAVVFLVAFNLSPLVSMVFSGGESTNPMYSNKQLMSEFRRYVAVFSTLAVSTKYKRNFVISDISPFRQFDEVVAFRKKMNRKLAVNKPTKELSVLGISLGKVKILALKLGQRILLIPYGKEVEGCKFELYDGKRIVVSVRGEEKAFKVSNILIANNSLGSHKKSNVVVGGQQSHNSNRVQIYGLDEGKQKGVRNK